MAALEAVLALRAHAGAGVTIDLLCPEDRFTYRPLSVLEAFDVTESTDVDLAQFADEQHVVLHSARLATVDPAAHRLQTTTGDELRYGALLIATGGRAVQALPDTLAFGGHADAHALREVLDHLDHRQAHRLAFVVPDASAWLVPLYELALMARAWLDTRGCRDVEITLITAEQDPLEMLGERSADIARMLLVQNRITLRAGVQPVTVEQRTVVLADGERIPADHIVTLPRLEGVRIPGVPQDPRGFIPIDRHGAVAGLVDVYAAGDITAGFPAQGGLAARQADAAAEAIAAALGFPLTPRPFTPIVEGVLLTGEELTAVAVPPTGEPRASAPWRAPTKILARYLAPYLNTREPASHFPGRWHGRDAFPGEISVGGGILAPTEHDRLATSRTFPFDLPMKLNPQVARAFAREELGALAADHEDTRRVRSALLAYLAAGCSLEVAAHDLGSRPDEVRQAIGLAEELLGHDITDRLFELRVALEVHARSARGLTASADPHDQGRTLHQG